MLIIPEIDDILNQYIQPESPGAALAIIQQDDVIHKAGYGLANLEWRIPATPDTVFRLASLTKQITAVAIMLLVQDGKLHVHEPVTHYLPEYPTSGHHLTIHHLLTHTAGLHNERLAGSVFYHADVKTSQMMNHFSQKPFEFKPGTAYRYSTTGYILLGAIIEAVTGKRYPQFVQERIFAPLGMETAVFFHHKPVIPRRAAGYEPQAVGFVHAPFLNATISHAGGGLGASLEDMIVWDRALRNHQLLPAETLALMHTAASLDDGTPLDYGYGWRVTTYHDHRVVEHSGSTPGYSTRLTTFPDVGLSIILLANRSGLNTQQIVAAVARHLLEISPKKQRPYILGADSLVKCVGVYRTNDITIRMVVEQEKLMLYGKVSYRLLPASRTQFYVPEDPDVRVTFGDEQDGLFQTLRLQEAFTGQVARRAAVPS